MEPGFFVVSGLFIGLGGVARTDWFNHSTTFQHHVDVRQPHRRLSGGVSHDHLLTTDVERHIDVWQEKSTFHIKLESLQTQMGRAPGNQNQLKNCQQVVVCQEVVV